MNLWQRCRLVLNSHTVTRVAYAMVACLVVNDAVKVALIKGGVFTAAALPLRARISRKFTAGSGSFGGANSDAAVGFHPISMAAAGW